MADEQDLPTNTDGLMDLSGFLGERDAAEEAMAKKVAERRLDRVADAGDMAQQPFADTVPGGEPQAPEPPVPAPAPEPAPPAPAPQADPEPPPLAADAGTDEPTYFVKIDGKDVQVTESELLKGYRMAEASERRFREAAQARREAEEMLRRAGSPQAQPAPHAAPEPPPAPPAASPEDTAAKRKKWAQALQYGTEAEVEAALAEMETARAAPAVDMAQVERMVEARLEREARQRDFNALVAKPENRPVFEDQELATVARARTLRLIGEELVAAGGDPDRVANLDPNNLMLAHAALEKAGRVRPQIELIQEAVDYTRGRFLPNAPAAPAPVDLDARRQRKQRLPTLPQAQAARAPTPSAPQPKTPAQIVAEERAARGQKNLNLG